MAAVYAQLGGEAKIESARETTLQDGVTEAMEFIVEWSASPYLSCFSLPASFRFDGKGSDEPRRAHS